MQLFKNLIKITFIKFFSFFCFEKKSKVIFYHDIHSNDRYTDMSTSIELFKKHIQIIEENGYEIVSHITKKYLPQNNLIKRYFESMIKLKIIIESSKYHTAMIPYWGATRVGHPMG